MSVEALDHVNIKTGDVPGTVAFLKNVLDLAVGPAPGMTSTDKGAWLRDTAGRPIFHIGDAALRYPTDVKPDFARSDTGPIHHVALSCQDYEGVRARIERLGYDVVENDVPMVS